MSSVDRLSPEREQEIRIILRHPTADGWAINVAKELLSELTALRAELAEVVGEHSKWLMNMQTLLRMFDCEDIPAATAKIAKLEHEVKCLQSDLAAANEALQVTGTRLHECEQQLSASAVAAIGLRRELAEARRERDVAREAIRLIAKFPPCCTAASLWQEPWHPDYELGCAILYALAESTDATTEPGEPGGVR